MTHSNLLALLLPPVSYATDQPQIRAELAAEGHALGTAMMSSDRAVGGINPFFAEQLLPDWERVCGITPPASAGYQQRMQTVLTRLAETGGLSIPYFKRLALSMGYRIEIVEPQPFRAGFSRAGDRLYVPDIIWVWQVIVHGSHGRVYYFNASRSTAGERLATFGDAVIKAVFNDLKPAHTFVCFAYQET